MDLSDVTNCVLIVNPLWNTSSVNFDAFLKTGSCTVCVCACVCVEQAFWHRLRPVGNADSISGGLALAEQMVCMIGPFQLQGDPHTHRKTETLD